MTVQEQLTEINKKLRKRAEGLKGLDIAIKSGVKQSNVSNWLKGENVGINALEKLAAALGMEVEIKLKQDFFAGHKDGF